MKYTLHRLMSENSRIRINIKFPNHMIMYIKPIIRNLLFGLAFLIFLGGQLKAQGGKVWTFDECLQTAIKNNPGLQQSQLQVQIDENNYLQSKVERYPNANAQVSQDFNFGRSPDPTSNDFVNRAFSSNNFGFSASMPLFNGFSISNTIKRNRTQVDMSKLDAQQAEYDLSLDVSLAYLNILLNQELFEVAEQNVLSTQQQLDRTQKLFDAGAVAENDVIDLKATLANNELAVVSAENDLRISKANLQQFMNIEVTDNFHCSTSCY